MAAISPRKFVWSVLGQLSCLGMSADKERLKKYISEYCRFAEQDDKCKDMKKRGKWLWLVALALGVPLGCKKEEGMEVQMHFRFKFDPQQVRLDNTGSPASVPAGHAAQTPDFREMSVHYVEFAPHAFTPLGRGAVVYHAVETTKGGESAVDFDQALRSDEDRIFLSIPLKKLPPGTYEWLRVSVTYQNYDIVFNINNIPHLGHLKSRRGRSASFVGFNTYLSQVRPKNKALTINANKKQGFWVFETDLQPPYDAFNQLLFGQAPEGATTVVNPLFASSPVPPNSCVVTGKFTRPLVITGSETRDVEVTLAFSIQKSLEWKDDNGNGELDFYADQTPSEKIVDMGLRGLIPGWK
jgi:hypothetical protein